MIQKGDIMDKDIIKFALGVAGLTLAAFIVWLLLREIRLWYWKTNNLIKMLKHISRRIYTVEKKIDELTQEISSINRNAMKLSELFNDSLITIAQNRPSSTDNEESEEVIARKIKD